MTTTDPRPGTHRTGATLRNIAQPKVLPWEQFQAMFSSAHSQGEHVAIVGPTGSGKSVLGLELCKIVGAKPGKDKRPSRVVVLSIKPRDDTIRRILPEKEWPIIKQWPPGYGQEHVIVWPRGGPPSGAAKRHRAVFLPLLDTIYREGGQTVCIDEAAYFERPLPAGLGMASTMEQFWTTARSVKLTLIAGTQRPRHVTRSMWSEPSWVMIFHLEDLDDLKRVAELSGRKMDVLYLAVKLGGHEFLCVRRQRGGQSELYVSRVDMGS